HGRTGLGLLEHGDDLAVGKAGLLHGTSSGKGTRKFHFWRLLMGGGITSLEQKRLVYLQRAIDFLRVASKDESRQFVKRLEQFHLKETDISTPNLRSQPWGPDPYTL
ncbi:hypothetical protein QYF96_21315, partial [Xanthomonas euvesicatoria]